MRLAQHGARDVVRVGDLDVARRHATLEHVLDAAEQLLVLELLVAEADERLERDLVAEPVLAGELEHLGADVALDEPEDVGVGAALHLAQQAALRVREEREFVDLRQAGGQERLREVEIAAAHHVARRCPSGRASTP